MIFRQTEWHTPICPVAPGLRTAIFWTTQERPRGASVRSVTSVWSVTVNHPAIRAAIPADRERVVESVVAAFDQDPAFRYFFADASTFAEQAAAFAAYLFDKRV